MPTYDYECRGCGHGTEVIQSFKDEPLKQCPECGDKDFHQIISGGAGLVFKGSGFYVTDNTGKKEKTTPSKQSESTTAKGTENSSSKADSGKAESSKVKSSKPESKKMEGVS